MKKIIGFVIILLIIGIECFTIYKMRQEADIKQYEVKSLQFLEENITMDIEEDVEEKTEELQYLNLIPEEYKGYKVSAKLKIEKININTYVLEDNSKEAMQIAQSKLFGPKSNEVRKLLYCWT